MEISKEELKQKISERLSDGMISCHNARKVAEENGVSYKTIGDLCNEAKIKIFACELGCFDKKK